MYSTRYSVNGEYSRQEMYVREACKNLLIEYGLNYVNIVTENYSDILWVWFEEYFKDLNEALFRDNQVTIRKVFEDIMSEKITDRYTDEQLNNLQSMLNSSDHDIFFMGINMLEHINPLDLKKIRTKLHGPALERQYYLGAKQYKVKKNEAVILPLYYIGLSANDE
jgi:hypothetical protein